MKKILSILILFLLSNCGYQPIYTQSDSSNIAIKSITLDGDKKINRRIIYLTVASVDKNNDLAYDLKLSSNKVIRSIAKDSTGNITKFRMTVNIDLSLERPNQNNKSKKFSLSFSYNNQANKFDLLQYQKNIENNLINKLSQEIKIFIDS